MDQYGVLLTILAGTFFLVGALLTLFFQRKTRFLDFILGLAFSITLGIVVYDLLPETIELFQNVIGFYRILVIITLIIFGMMVGKIIDIFVPHHHGDEEQRLNHIGIATTNSLLLHNIIEGFMIYALALTGRIEALILALAIALHNIPLGMHVFTSIRKGKASAFMQIFLLSLLFISVPLGAVVYNIFQSSITDHILGGLMAVAIGMLLYIIIFELFREIMKNRDRRSAGIGIVMGIIIIFISLLIH